MKDLVAIGAMDCADISGKRLTYLLVPQTTNVNQPRCCTQIVAKYFRVTSGDSDATSPALSPQCSSSAQAGPSRLYVPSMDSGGDASASRAPHDHKRAKEEEG